MGLLKRNNQLFDSIRKKWVEATPEEIIRQDLIEKMVKELGYPPSLLSVERELSSLSHLRLIKKELIPKRRADIIAFAREIHPEYALFPLLMVECKAVPLTTKFTQQVVGYNCSVQAFFLSLANREQIMTGHFDQRQGHYQFKRGLPSYATLLQLILP